MDNFTFLPKNELEQAFLRHVFQFGFREYVKIFLKRGDGVYRLCLVKARFRRAHVEAFAYVERGYFGIYAFGVCLAVFLECHGRSLVVFVAVLGHGQHIEALFGVVGAFLYGHQFLKQGYGLRVFAVCETLFGVFVFVSIVL